MRAYVYVEKSICRCLVVELYLTLRNPMDCSTPGFLVLHHLPEFAQTQSTESVMPCNLLIFCFPFLLSPSIFPSIRVFSSQSALHIRWPKDWSFSFSINASDEYSGLISFRTEWFDLLLIQGTLKCLLQHHSSKASVLQHSAFFMVQLSLLEILKSISVRIRKYPRWFQRETDSSLG